MAEPSQSGRPARLPSHLPSGGQLPRQPGPDPSAPVPPGSAMEQRLAHGIHGQTACRIGAS